MNFKKKFSLAHPESMPECPNHYYLILKNTKPEVLDEIYDIYFGKFFKYKFNNEEKIFGNTMGVEATDEQLENLFKIQMELNIDISLTMNTLDIPFELQHNLSLQNEFIEWIGSFYDRGLRSCTISWIHLMRTGRLQNRCPDMRWKNTVNHRITDTQSVVEYIHLGYDTIMLDRNYSRNINELIKTHNLIQKYNKNRTKQLKTVLLAREGCISNCPFKKEHDSISSIINTQYFYNIGQLSCTIWRQTPFYNLPRNGVDLTVNSKDVANKIYPIIDVIKSSGRFLSHSYISEQDIIDKKYQFIWINDQNDYNNIQEFTGLCAAKTFQSIYENTNIGYKNWDLKISQPLDDNLYIENDIKRYNWLLEINMKNDFWLKEESRILENTLMNCKSQCYNCHKCELAFGVDEIDSALQIF
jgi:hypothetical protein